MKFSSQEEYGLRFLLRIGKSNSTNGLTIPEISQLEGLSTANVGKILRVLRLGGFIDSARGQVGGYKLAKEPKDIILSDVLSALGGRLFDNEFCNDFKGTPLICTNSIDCSVRSLWMTIQKMLDDLLVKMTLKDLLGNEAEVQIFASNITEALKQN